ncbi:hypothetical protein ACP4OV_001470 [Aristida adscensionis]
MTKLPLVLFELISSSSLCHGRRTRAGPVFPTASGATAAAAPAQGVQACHVDRRHGGHHRVLLPAVRLRVYQPVRPRGPRRAWGRGGGGGPSRRGKRGLDPAVVATFLIVSYREIVEHKIGKGILECVVCLTAFEDGDETSACCCTAPTPSTRSALTLGLGRGSRARFAAPTSRSRRHAGSEGTPVAGAGGAARALAAAGGRGDTGIRGRGGGRQRRG